MPSLRDVLRKLRRGQFTKLGSVPESRFSEKSSTRAPCLRNEKGQRFPMIRSAYVVFNIPNSVGKVPERRFCGVSNRYHLNRSQKQIHNQTTTTTKAITVTKTKFETNPN
jgi:hypothetical protein